MSKQDKDPDVVARDAANVRIAVGLGIFAFCMYAGFILMHWLN